MWRFKKQLGTQSMNSIPNMSDPLSRSMIRLIREEIYRILEVPILREIFPCTICKGKVKPGYKCALRAILAWIVTENVSSDARNHRCRKTIKRISKKRMVGRKPLTFKRIRRDIQINKILVPCKKPISHKVGGWKTRISTRRTIKKRLGLKRSFGGIRKIRNERITSLKHEALIKRSVTSKSVRRNQNPTRRYVKKCLVHRRYALTRPIRRRRLSSKSQMRTGNKIQAPKRSQKMRSSKFLRNKKTAAKGYQSCKTKSCPPLE